MSPHKDLYTDVYSSTTYNNQKVDTSQIPISQRMDSKTWYIPTMECDSTIKRNRVLLYATIWMNLVDITLSEKAAHKRLCMTTYDSVHMKCSEQGNL